MYMYMRWNLGCCLGMGVIKENGRGSGEIPLLLFCLFLKYLTRYMLQTSCVDENHHFLTYSAKNPEKILCFYGKKLIFADFYVYFQCIQISEGALILCVTVTSYEVQWYWYSFWYRGGPYLYTGSNYRGIRCVLYRKSREGVATTPPSEDVLQKIPQEGEG